MPESEGDAGFVERTDLGPVTRVRITSRGFLNMEDTSEFGKELYDLVDQEGRSELVIDLTDVETPSSGFIGKLLWLIIKARKLGGRVALCSLAPSLRKVFQPLPDQQPGEAFGFFDNEKDALEWVMQHASAKCVDPPPAPEKPGNQDLKQGEES